MYLPPLNMFLHDQIPETGHPVYDATPGSTVVYVGPDRTVVTETVIDDEGHDMHGRVRVPLLELGVQELTSLSESVLLAAAEVECDPSGGLGEVRTTAGGQAIVSGLPEYVGRLATQGGRSGLLIYNVAAVQLSP